MRGNTTAKNNGCDTESGEECETAQQKNSCLQFNMFMQNIPLMDRELFHVCASVCEVFFRHLTGNGVGHHTISIEQTKRPPSPDHVYEEHRAQSFRAAFKGWPQ